MPSPPPSQDALAKHLLQTLPPSSYAFAYGSGIIPQTNVNPNTRMLDLVVVIENPLSWHSHNLSLNPNHYSIPMQLLGPTIIATLQQHPFAARVYYNTILPPTTRHPFKYGVITRQDLIRDLCTWDSLYLSGRMHKPIRHLSPPPPSLTDALHHNRLAATAAALLSLPSHFLEQDLYTAIASLSYTGDIRNRIPIEVGTKVRDIVRANTDRFRSLYLPLTRDIGVTHMTKDGKWTREIEVRGQMRLLTRLPTGIREAVTRRLGVTGGLEAVARCESAAVGRAVVATVATVVARSSIRQGMVGLATAGVGNSARYVAAKVGKSLRARFRRLGVMQQFM
eukprot:GFKZ01009289.1.p1 GENE.GFKZ01009289.1~~GFKZ01009289.1.p1  ORF type:complete len:337 (+),score=28.60 GFKZ01009289.1:75-1085(+)